MKNQRSKTIPLTATIITKNEQNNVTHCIQSLMFAAEIVVVDAESSDNTTVLATQLGARVIVQPWLGFGSQKQIAVAAATNDWIVSIDADERVDLALALFIEEFVNKASEQQVLYISRRTYFLGKPIKFCGWNPDYVGRVFNRTATNFSPQLVHETLEQVAEKIYAPPSLKLLHYSYPTEESIQRKIQRYGKLGAKELKKRNATPKMYAIIYLKTLFTFIRTYIFRLGILDGMAGIQISQMNAKTTYFKYMLHRHLHRLNTN